MINPGFKLWVEKSGVGMSCNHDKVVVLTPNLVVTRTSPTPEDISPTETKALAKSLQVAILINNFKIE